MVLSPPTTCNFNGAPVAVGGFVTAYATSSVPCGQTCASETRTCSTGGTLSGTYMHSSCSPAACPTGSGPCSISGQMKWNGTIVQWCDGQNWHDATGSTCSTCKGITDKPIPGKIETGSGLPVYWNGSKWISMEGTQIPGGCGTQKPKSFKAYGSVPVELRYCDASGTAWKIPAP